MAYLPIENYGLVGNSEDGVATIADYMPVGLASPVSMERTEGSVTATFTLEQGGCTRFSLHKVDVLLDHTIDCWHRGVSQYTYDGCWNETVYRYDTDKVDDGRPGSEGSFNMCTLDGRGARAGRSYRAAAPPRRPVHV